MPKIVQKDSGNIRGLFADISPRYDFLNHFLSLNVDRLWRRRVVKELRLARGERVLDACTGTGDLAIEIARRLAAVGGGSVVGTDFTREMLQLASPKAARLPLGPAGTVDVRFVLADTLQLPFAEGTFDAVTVGFGIRNLVDLDRGLREMRRVLRPCGRAAVLEFSQPRGLLLGRGFRFYFHRVLPHLGGWISGSRRAREAYRYLPASVAEFLSPQELSRRLEAAGLRDVRSKRLSGGIATLHTAVRPPREDIP